LPEALSLVIEPGHPGSFERESTMDRTTYVNELHARYAIADPMIITVVERAAGRKAATVERVIRGDEHEVHRVRLSDDSVVYLRVAWPGSPAKRTHDEAWAMGQARDAGVPAPEVLAIPAIESADGLRTAMVLREVPGRRLGDLLSGLSADRRSSVMEEFGRTLRTLHSIAMPGAGLPDDHGVWADPATKRRSYAAGVRDASRHLPTAGLTPEEIDRVIKILDSSIVPLEDPPVLCHGDLTPEHVYVDTELRVVGLIDWGMWHAGSAGSDLAGIMAHYPPADLDAIRAGHGFPADPDTTNQLCWHLITQAIGQIRWLVDSDQADELAQPVTTIRNAVSMITD
jgi:aminoglycoside phosphotransferase (APT) family kinase protein